MDEKSALKELGLSWFKNYHTVRFIEKLYKDGYAIISLKELKEINGMIVLTEMHGMNPFARNKL